MTGRLDRVLFFVYVLGLLVGAAFIVDLIVQTVSLHGKEYADSANARIRAILAGSLLTVLHVGYLLRRGFRISSPFIYAVFFPVVLISFSSILRLLGKSIIAPDEMCEPLAYGTIWLVLITIIPIALLHFTTRRLR